MGEVIIKTYSTLRKYVDLLKDRNIKLLCIIGKGGIGKTKTVEECLRGIDYGFFTSHATPLSIYKTAYEYRDKLLVFDDVSNLTRDDNCLALLRQIADTKEINEISWMTTSKKLGDIPTRFTTKSKVIIIANYFKKPNPVVMSFLDRGILIKFEPTIEELFKYAEENILNRDGRNDSTYQDKKIHIMKRLKEIVPFCKNITLRTIVASLNIYNELSEDEFYDFIFQQAEISQEAQTFLRLKDLPTNEALEKWKDSGYPERTMYHYKKLYLENPLFKSN